MFIFRLFVCFKNGISPLGLKKEGRKKKRGGVGEQGKKPKSKKQVFLGGNRARLCSAPASGLRAPEPPLGPSLSMYTARSERWRSTGWRRFQKQPGRFRRRRPAFLLHSSAGRLRVPAGPPGAPRIPLPKRRRTARRSSKARRRRQQHHPATDAGKVPRPPASPGSGEGATEPSPTRTPQPPAGPDTPRREAGRRGGSGGWRGGRSPGGPGAQCSAPTTPRHLRAPGSRPGAEGGAPVARSQWRATAGTAPLRSANCAAAVAPGPAPRASPRLPPPSLSLPPANRPSIAGRAGASSLRPRSSQAQCPHHSAPPPRPRQPPRSRGRAAKEPHAAPEPQVPYPCLRAIHCFPTSKERPPFRNKASLQESRTKGRIDSSCPVFVCYGIYIYMASIQILEPH